MTTIKEDEDLILGCNPWDNRKRNRPPRPEPRPQPVMRYW